MLQAKPGSSGKQQLEQNSPNLRTTFKPSPLSTLISVNPLAQLNLTGKFSIHCGAGTSVNLLSESASHTKKGLHVSKSKQAPLSFPELDSEFENKVSPLLPHFRDVTFSDLLCCVFVPRGTSINDVYRALNINASREMERN